MFQVETIYLTNFDFQKSRKKIEVFDKSNSFFLGITLIQFVNKICLCWTTSIIKLSWNNFTFYYKSLGSLGFELGPPGWKSNMLTTTLLSQAVENCLNLSIIFVSEVTESCKGSKWGFFGVPSTTRLFPGGWHVYFTCLHVSP